MTPFFCVHSIKKGNNALSFLTDPPAGGVVQESLLHTGDSCTSGTPFGRIRRNDILFKEFSLPLNIEWIPFLLSLKLIELLF